MIDDYQNLRFRKVNQSVNKGITIFFVDYFYTKVEKLF